MTQLAEPEPFAGFCLFDLMVVLSSPSTSRVLGVLR